MKKILILFLILISYINISNTYAWDDCPHGEVNDTYPGECNKYIDTDNNGICDHSEPAPENRVIDVPETNDNTDTASFSTIIEDVSTTSVQFINSDDTLNNDEEEINKENYIVKETTTTNDNNNRDLIGIILITSPLIILGIYLIVAKFKK